MKEKNPIPQGKYVPATRNGNTIYTAGMTPRDNGVLIKVGPIHPDVPLEDYKQATCQAAKNALVAARNMLADNERLAGILALTVYVNAYPGFSKQSAIADFASEYLCEQLGEAGIAARASVGVESLPGNAPCEISLVAFCEKLAN